MTAAPVITPAEYLVRERAAEFKSELLNGEIVAMAGANRRHRNIGPMLSAILGEYEEAGGCPWFNSDMRVRLPGAGYCYPDAALACDPQYEDEAGDTFLNPVALFEILSPSTEARDRGAKWEGYRRIESLRHYVLIAADRASVEVYDRVSDGWLLHIVEGRDAVARLPGLLDLPLSRLYRRLDVE